MLYKPKNLSALHIALAGLPDRMRVETDPGVALSAKTVGELRKAPDWPEHYVVATPQARDAGDAVHVSRASMATRTSPKT